jgi:hypothetical protein
LSFDLTLQGTFSLMQVSHPGTYEELGTYCQIEDKERVQNFGSGFLSERNVFRGAKETGE